MVKAKKAIESLYIGVCSVTEHQKVVKANKSTGFQDTPVYEDKPCRVSFQSIAQTEADPNGAAALTQIIKLFISPDITIKTGSKIVVTQNGVTTEYKSSGVPAIYDTHQEIILELFKGWS